MIEIKIKDGTTQIKQQPDGLWEITTVINGETTKDCCFSEKELNSKLEKLQ